MNEKKRAGCYNKRKFSSHNEAQKFHPRKRTYRCEFCCQWHLTAEKSIRKRLNDDYLSKRNRRFGIGRKHSFDDDAA